MKAKKEISKVKKNVKPVKKTVGRKKPGKCKLPGNKVYIVEYPVQDIVDDSSKPKLVRNKFNLYPTITVSDRITITHANGGVGLYGTYVDGYYTGDELTFSEIVRKFKFTYTAGESEAKSRTVHAAHTGDYYFGRRYHGEDRLPPDLLLVYMFFYKLLNNHQDISKSQGIVSVEFYTMTVASCGLLDTKDRTSNHSFHAPDPIGENPAFDVKFATPVHASRWFTRLVDAGLRGSIEREVNRNQ